MSQFEPMLPHPDHDADRQTTAAAEPGVGASPAAPEEPDVLEGEPDPTADGVELPPATPFRTPTPGERLSPEELADRS